MIDRQIYVITEGNDIPANNTPTYVTDEEITQLIQILNHAANNNERIAEASQFNLNDDEINKLSQRERIELALESLDTHAD